VTRGRPRSAAGLATEVARAARRPGAARTLLLDLDGTLAAFAPRPEEVQVTRATLEALDVLTRAGWIVAIVSGRPAADVRRLVPLRRVRVVGSHGAEIDGRRARVSAPQRSRLHALGQRARTLASSVPGSRVEHKPAGLALHDRDVAPRHLAPWRSGVRDLLAGSDLAGLEVLRGRRVLEVRVRGPQKGRAVTLFLSRRRPGRRDASLVAIGDDRTDEDMFAAVRGRGLSVKVGRSAARTRAIRRLTTPRAVVAFLRALAAGNEERR
jgi:trehalose-phosphatase